MIRWLRTAAAVSLVLVLAACAGTDFVRPSAGTFTLGTTTSAQVLQQMGQPRQTAEVLRNDKTIKALSYVYAAAAGESLEPGVTPARAQAYYFHNDILVGREFLSSFRSDHSNFDETKIGSIAKGQTSRAEVIRLLGPATAAYVPPMVKQTRGEAIGYAYQATSGGLLSGIKFYRKNLRITFDGNDAAEEIEFTSSGSKPN